MLDREEIARLVEGRTTTNLPALRLEQWSLYEGRIDRVVDYAAAVTRHLPVIHSTTVSTAASAW